MDLGTAKKIVLFGLAESGKSAIMKTIIEGKPPAKNDLSHATIDYERKELIIDDYELTFFDLGGYTAFLDRFVGELSEFMFSGVKVLIFVLDSIKIPEISRTKYYFDACLKNIEKYSPEASVVIFQHKTDLIQKKLREDVHHTCRDYILSGINKPMLYYETSIFTCSIVIAMSAVFQQALGYIPNNWHFSTLDEKNNPRD